MNKQMKKLFKSVSVILLAISIIFSLLLVMNIIPVNAGKGIGAGNGLDYGLDFAGGTQLQLRLEKPLDTDTMAVEKGIIENRLNSLGLKDIPVRPWGNQYLLIQIAGASPAEITQIENILKQQARFEERIDGELAVIGDEITVDLSPQGVELYSASEGYGWSVRVSHTPEGACRFGKVGAGKKGRPVDIFLDRPQNTTILMSNSTYSLLQNVSGSGENDKIYFGGSAIDVILKRAVIPVVVFNDLDSALMELEAYRGSGYVNVILAGDESRMPGEVRNRLEEDGFKTVRIVKADNQTYDDWVSELVGLQSSPRLNFDTRGECVYDAMITGVAGTLEEAKMEVKKNQVLLTSGNLPAKATVESKSTTPPTLGMKFLRYAFYTGIIAMITVALIVFVRYRNISITLPIIMNSLFEILITLGLAALINWQIDLSAVGGIITSVGTGIDHEVVITDEALSRRKGQKRVLSMRESISRAFTIIFTASFTVIAAMLPLISIGAGMLKGFAFTTVMGVLVGILITRPAYAKIVEIIVE